MKNVIFVLLSVFLLASCSSEANEEPEANLSVVCEETIYNNEEVLITAAADLPVTRVSFYFDGVNIGESIRPPYSIRFTPKDYLPGSYLLECIAEVKGRVFRAKAPVSVVLRLGDSFQGGKVFYLEGSGEHGLIASTSDFVFNGEFGAEDGFFWGKEGLIGTTRNNGKANTELMASNSPSLGYAGYHFRGGNYINGFSDWYIPSIEELELLRANMDLVGGFVRTGTPWQDFYWSSSESSETSAFCLNFYALAGNTSEKSLLRKVRVIRSF